MSAAGDSVPREGVGDQEAIDELGATRLRCGQEEGRRLTLVYLIIIITALHSDY